MPKSKPGRKSSAEARPCPAGWDLEHAKGAVPASLTSASGQRTYDHAIREFVTRDRAEPRLASSRLACYPLPNDARCHHERRG